jgi:hypothetical protein
MSKKVPGGKATGGRGFASGGRAGRAPGRGFSSLMGLFMADKPVQRPLGRLDKKSPGKGRGPKG